MKSRRLFVPAAFLPSRALFRARNRLIIDGQYEPQGFLMPTKGGVGRLQVNLQPSTSDEDGGLRHTPVPVLKSRNAGAKPSSALTLIGTGCCPDGHPRLERKRTSDTVRLYGMAVDLNPVPSGMLETWARPMVKQGKRWIWQISSRAQNAMKPTNPVIDQPCRPLAQKNTDCQFSFWISPPSSAMPSLNVLRAMAVSPCTVTSRMLVAR
ncbi:hypothetical protein SAMN03159406_04917 [Rhizobium sp. NFR03]|nr:hypothetical protein SAMN03159406_04917 [Rhizobium sp. NFR03]